jgi:glycosyltransferase involved in cell wall biosynthesis
VTVYSNPDFPCEKTGNAYTVTGFPIPVLLMARELDIGGSERQMTETAKALDRSIFEPHVGCFRPAGIRGDELRAAGVPVVQFPVMSYLSPRVLIGAARIARYVRDHRIRIVHTWDAPITLYAIPIARTMTKAVALSSQRAHRDLLPGMARRLARISDHFADAVVVNCESLRGHLIHDERVRPAKIHVCYNGIDLGRFHRASTAPHPTTIGTLCALRPEKDLTTLIGAFARVRKLHPELKLAIVGSGPQLAALQQYAREAGAADAVHFEPTTARVPQWLSSIDIFVLPSLSEAFSNSLMEAMACGCCAVASNVGGNPELVKPGETGLLFKPRDPDDLASALRTLIENPELRRGLAARGEAFLANFSIASAARRMGEIYTSLLVRNRDR